MSTTRTSRPIPLALTTLVALFSALAALAVSGGMDMSHTHGTHSHAGHPAITTTVHPSPAR